MFHAANWIAATCLLGVFLALCQGVTFCPRVVEAQGTVSSPEGATGLTMPEPGIEAPARPPPEAASPSENVTETDAVPPDEDTEDSAEPWRGPRVELGYATYVLSDGFDGGTVHAVTFGGFLPTAPFRIGGRAEAGVRGYGLGQDDLVLRADVSAGYQYLELPHIAPYLSAVATAGVVLGKRFSTSLSYAVAGLGLEFGADFPIVARIFAGLSFSYLRVDFDGSGHDLFMFRMRLGL